MIDYSQKLDSEEIKSICKNSEQTILIHISIIDS